jgi:bifunctional oligoribonuclease and PAP phosphatase NrnA
MSIATGDWQAATAAINQAKQAVISCHLHPDGDALGSALALHGALVKAGRDAVVSFSEPFEVAAQYRFLPGVERLTPPGKVPTEPEVFVCFDTGSLDRLGSLAGAFQHARRTVVIDHHASNTRFGDVNLIDPDAPASAVLCRELLRRLDLPIDQEIATNLYTALVTDTGRFQYQSTAPETHLLAAELLAAGVRQYEVAKAVFETNDIRYLRLLSQLLARITQVPEASLVWTTVTQQDLKAYGIGMDATEGLIDLVRTDGASDVAAVLKEQPEGGFKVSLRSRGGTNVAEVAGRFGGGGHALASGFTSKRDAAGTIDEIVEALVAQHAAADGSRSAATAAGTSRGPDAPGAPGDAGDGAAAPTTSSAAASGR